MSSGYLFKDDRAQIELLRKRAYMRWNALPESVIPLTAADPDFPVAPEISTVIQEYARDGLMGYGVMDGVPGFQECMAQVAVERYGIDCIPQQIIPIAGAAAGMWLTSVLACQPGDEAILFDPVDYLFGLSIDVARASRVLLPIDKKNPELDLDCLHSLITPRTRLLCLCNPHNPLGRVFSRQELTALGEIALQHNLLIMSDEVWADIIYPPHRHISLASLSPELAARTLTIFGTSKSFAIAGLRVGFLVVPQPFLEQAKKISLAIGIPFGVTTLSQLVAMTAYQRCGYWLKAFCQHLQEQRDYAVARLNQVPGVSCNTPQGTYVLFPDVSTFGLSSQQVTDLLLEHGVAVVPGTPQYFGPGAEGHIRIAFSTSREILRQGLDRIQKGCNTLQSNKGKDK